MALPTGADRLEKIPFLRQPLPCHRQHPDSFRRIRQPEKTHPNESPTLDGIKKIEIIVSLGLFLF
jgi:hypothetical protein